MRRRVVITVLAVALVITGYYAFSQYRVSKDLVRRTESQYQRNFYELVWNLDTINSQLAQTLVSSSSEQIMESLSNLWRETFSANSNLGGIPITMVELDKTDKLLNDIAQYAYYVLKTNTMQKKELTEKEWNQLQEFYERSKVVKNELHNMEAAVLNRDLSFVELENVTLRKGNDLADSAIVDGFKSIESKVKAFPDLEFDEGVQKIEPEPQPMQGEKINEQKAVEIAKKFMNDHDGPITKAEVAFSSEGEIPVYGIATYKKNQKTPTYVEVTKTGGYVIQMYIQREIKEAEIDFLTAEKNAKEFLKEHDLINMEVIEIKTDTNTAILTLVPTQKGVLLYSDMVKTNIALDNGQVISFDKTSYLSYHKKRVIPKPAVSEQEVLDDMNPNFKVERVRLALIPNEFETKEVFVYEVRGKMKEESFILFINALTGEDERVVRITKPKEYQVKVR